MKECCGDVLRRSVVVKSCKEVFVWRCFCGGVL